MIPRPNNLKVALIALAITLIGGQVAQAQDQYTGLWEGKFMKDFPTVIMLEATEEGSFHGKILMYSGEMRIQDDELSRISIEKDTLSFYIEAKVSTFKGTFNEECTELSGYFVFPDDSEHPLLVKKKDSHESN